jgi:periplasmic copper chaperone A
VAKRIHTLASLLGQYVLSVADGLSCKKGLCFMRLYFGFLVLVIGSIFSTDSHLFADEQGTSMIQIKGTWARATPPGATNGAVYLSIQNIGKQAEQLIGVASPMAKIVELHNHEMVDGLMRMRKLDSIDVAAGATVTIAPGGLHIMLIGLARTLVDGEEFAITLSFSLSGQIETAVKIQR